LTLLSNLGWSFLFPSQALIARDGKPDQVILRGILRAELAKRSFGFAGQNYPLLEKSIDNLIVEMCS